MDNSNLPTPIAGSPLPITPTPVQNPIPPTTSTEGGGNKLIMMLAIALVVIALAIAGFYFYSVNQKGTETPPVTQTDPEGVNSLEAELNSSNLDDLDSELSAVDQDLQSL